VRQKTRSGGPAEPDPTTMHGFTRKKTERAPLPAHLPRKRGVVPAPRSCPCCASTLVKLGEEITETLEVAPRQWKVIQTVCEKFTCRSCEKITQPQPLPPDNRPSRPWPDAYPLPRLRNDDEGVRFVAEADVISPACGWCSSSFSPKESASICVCQKPLLAAVKAPAASPGFHISAANARSRRVRRPHKSLSRRLPPAGRSLLDQFRVRLRELRVRTGLGGVGDLSQRLRQFGDAREARLRVLPVAQIDDLVVGAEF
jgi:transposase IS66-like protein